MADPKKESIINIDKVKPLKTPGQKRQRVMAIVILLVIAAIAFAGYKFLNPAEKAFVLTDYDTAVVQLGDMSQNAQASGTVTVPVQMDVLNGSDGYAMKLYVSEGDYVGKGQVLAELDVPDQIDELDDLLIDYETQQRTYTKTEQQNIFTEDKLQRELASIEADIVEAQEEVARLTKLVTINASRKSELESAKDQLAALEDQKNEQLISIEQETTLNKLEMQDQLANLRQMKTRIERLEEDIEEARVKSPMTGEVLSIADALTIPGKEISANSTLFTIADRSSTMVELEISEQYSNLLILGQPVELTIGSDVMTGTLTSIGNIATVSSDGLGSNIVIEAVPDNNPESLLLGASVVAELSLGVISDVLIVPRGPFLSTGSQKTMYVIDESGKYADKTTVSFGTSDGNNIEVTGGVEAGERFILSGYQNFISYDRIQLGE